MTMIIIKWIMKVIKVIMRMFTSKANPEGRNNIIGNDFCQGG